MNSDEPLVEEIRLASRTMVRELGFMQTTLAGTAYSASAVHALLEIGTGRATNAAQLVQVLGLEKSSVSRMLAKLIKAGELKETGGNDGRVKQLLLTAQGKRTVDEIDRYGQTQVRTAMAYLNSSEQQAVARGIKAYAKALQTFRLGGTKQDCGSLAIRAGYQPGLIGRVVEMHARFYSRHSGFGQYFESKVAGGLAEFVGRLEGDCNQIWVATQNDRIVGSIAIDGEDLGNNEAHLRWFILDDGCRGAGVGRRLLAEAVQFCDRVGFSAIQLWTFKGLDAARKLYESFGFKLVQEEAGAQWGSVVTEQQFTRCKL